MVSESFGDKNLNSIQKILKCESQSQNSIQKPTSKHEKINKYLQNP